MLPYISINKYRFAKWLFFFFLLVNVSMRLQCTFNDKFKFSTCIFSSFEYFIFRKESYVCYMFLQCFLIYFTNSYSQSNCVVPLHSILVSLIALQPICFNESENHPYRNKNRPKLIKSLQAHLELRLFNFWLEMISDDGESFSCNSL